MKSFFISTTMDFLPFKIRSYAISQPVRLPPMITTRSPTSRPQRYSVASMACSSPEMGAFFAVQHGLLFLIQVHLHTISFFRRKTAGCAALSIAILPREGKEGGSIPHA